MSRKTRYWVFTLNLDGTTVQEATESLRATSLRSGLSDSTSIDFAVYQLERGESGTYHYQGYVVWKVRRTRETITRIAAYRPAHWEPRMGSHEQARDYCTKVDTGSNGGRVAGTEPTVHGSEEGLVRGQGQRTDHENVQTALQEGASEADIAAEHFGWFVRYHGGLKAALRLQKPHQRARKPRVYVLWGETGAGKSFHARRLAGENAYWVSRPTDGQPLWFDGIARSDNIIFDEFYGWAQLDFILRLLDMNPIKLKVHGDMVDWDGEIVIFTTNVPWREWYRNVSELRLRSLERRLDVIVEFVTAWQDGAEQIIRVEKGDWE